MDSYSGDIQNCTVLSVIIKLNCFVFTLAKFSFLLWLGLVLHHAVLFLQFRRPIRQQKIAKDLSMLGDVVYRKCTKWTVHTWAPNLVWSNDGMSGKPPPPPSIDRFRVLAYDTQCTSNAKWSTALRFSTYLPNGRQDIALCWGGWQLKVVGCYLLLWKQFKNELPMLILALFEENLVSMPTHGKKIHSRIHE